MWQLLLETMMQIDIPLINCEVSLALNWSSNCVITSLEKTLVTPAEGGNPAV